MIDVKVLRTDPDRVKASQRARGESETIVDEALAADATRRSSIAAYEGLRAEQKDLGKLIPKATPEERTELLARTKELADQVKKAEAAEKDAAVAFDVLLKAVPNLIIDGVPVGGEDDYVVLEERGTIRDFAAEGFTPRDHLELGQLLGAIDVERGAKVSGSRFYFLTGQG
ncbi:MAG TPA: serine--tRNA ligase, partial [Microlunatus sp.]